MTDVLLIQIRLGCDLWRLLLRKVAVWVRLCPLHSPVRVLFMCVFIIYFIYFLFFIFFLTFFFGDKPCVGLIWWYIISEVGARADLVQLFCTYRCHWFWLNACIYMWMDVIVRYCQVYNCVNSRSVLLAVRADNHKHEFHISTRHWHNTATTLHLKPNSKIRYLQTALNWFLSLSFFYFSCLEFGVYTSVFSMIYIYIFCCQKVTWYAERSLRIKRRKSIPVSPSANGDFVHKILVKRIKIVTVWSFYFVHCFVWISVS